MILVTGANGFLGSFLVDKLLSAGYEVIAAGRSELNVLDKESVDKMFNNNNIEYVIHTAVRGGRRTRPDEYIDFYENILMFENLAYHRKKFKLMFNFCSGAAFDRAKDIDKVKEADISMSTPADFYGLSKNVIAKRIQGIDDNIINLRIFNCFGEKEQPDRMIKASCIRHLHHDKMVVHTNKKMDFFYIEDLYRVIRHYLENFSKELPMDMNLCYERKFDLIGITGLIMTLTGRPNDVKLIDEVNGRPYTGDHTKLSSLDIKLYGLEGGILKVYKFLQGRKYE